MKKRKTPFNHNISYYNTEDIKVVDWTADKTKFDEMDTSFSKLLSYLVDEAQKG